MKRRMGLLLAVFFALLLPGTALAADESAAVQARGGAWSEAASVLPGEEVRCRAALTLTTGESWTVRAVFAPGVEFGALVSVRAGEEEVNASFYTLVTGSRAQESAFALHLAAGFSARGSTELTFEWTAELGDACSAGAAGNAVSLTAVSESGRTAASGEAVLYTCGISVFRGVRFGESEQDHPLALACFRLYYDRELRYPVAFREQGRGVFLACAAQACAHTRHTYILRTGESGTIRLDGLAAGTYYLQESRPPAGYESAANALRVDIAEDGTAAAEGAPFAGDTLLLLDVSAETRPEEDDALTFYRRGCGVMVVLLLAAMLGKRYTMP